MGSAFGGATGLGRYLDDLRTLPGDAWLRWRLDGWAGVWAQVRERTVNRVYRAGRFLVFEQDLDAFIEAPAPAGVTIGVLAGEWPRLASIVGRRQLAAYRRRAAAGRVCVAAFRGDRAVGYGWYTDRMDPSIEYYTLPLPPDAAYTWDLYVVPPERNRGIGAALTSARLRLAREQGLRRAWRLIAPGNIASRRAAEKLAGGGYRVIGEVVSRKVLRRDRSRFLRYEMPADPRIESAR